MANKIKYTTGDEFVLNGSNYIGYYNTVDNKPYVSKYEQKTPLIPVDDINTMIHLSDMYFDRSVYDRLELPVKLENVLFQPNELINKNSLNYKFEQLYDNFIYLYKNSKLADPLLPTNFSHYAILSADEFKWIEANRVILSAGTQDISLSSFSPLLQTKTLPGEPGIPPELYINTIEGRYTDRYTLFLSVSNTIFNFYATKDFSTLSFVNSADAVGRYKETKFERITDVRDDDRNNLYVCDGGANNIYKLDVSNIVNFDRTGVRDFRLINSVGGTGRTDVNFVSASKIAIGNEEIFVYDKGERSIKHLTSDFAYIKKYINKRFFRDNPVANITYNSFNNRLYILTTTFKVLVLSVDIFAVVDEYEFQENFTYVSSSGGLRALREEIPIELVFSKNDSNIYYLLTNKKIYKYFVNRRNKLISRFLITENVEFAQVWNTTFYDFNLNPEIWNFFPEGDNFFFTNIDILEEDENYDRMTVMGTNIILQFLENNNTRSLLSDENLNAIDFSLNDILFTDEFFNNITFNSAIYKLLYNHYLFGSLIAKKGYLKHLYEFDELLFQKFAIQSVDKENKLSLLLKNNFYVGMNEVISVNVFNRVLRNIYEYQLLVLNLLQFEITNREINPSITVTF